MRELTGNRIKTSQITKIAILSALAGIIMYFETTLPFMPPFLKIDLSEIPALIGSFALGPISGIFIELIKNLIHLPATQTFCVGELANFIMGSFFVATAGYIYKYKKTRSGAVIAMIFGTLSMTVAASLANYFFLIDFYAKLYHISMKDLVDMSTKVNGLVKDLKSLIVFAFIPFNIFKGLVVSLITALIYKHVSPILHSRHFSGK
ncbi:MAG: ECF transporter S component [Bacillota bacterium]|nr:ECF transporter S component [Bacillota bacterium]